MYARVFYILHTETKKTSRQREAKEERAKKNIGHKLYKTCQQHNLAREERKQRQFARCAAVNKKTKGPCYTCCALVDSMI